MLDEAEVELDEMAEADGWAECVTDAQSRHTASEWLARKVAEFEASGGTITAVPHGMSGVEGAVSMDYITNRLLDQRKVVNDARSLKKEQLEPIRLSILAEEMAKGTRGLIALAKATGMSAALVKELAIRHKIDIGAGGQAPNKSYNQKTLAQVAKIFEDINLAMDSPSPPKHMKELSERIKVPYTTLLRLADANGWELQLRMKRGQPA